jgi:phage terminase large subunit-like protein
MQMLSPALSLASLPEVEREREIAKLSTELRAQLRWHWPFWARPQQIAPGGDWSTWLVLAGRGFGKTRAGCEWVRSIACGSTPLVAGTHKRIAIIAETAADARDVLVEGESGLLAIHPSDFRPHYEPSKRRLTWPNGAIATLYNAVEPDQLRGPQHDAALCDELAKWRYAEDTWDQLQFGLRLGDDPRVTVTTTPRPIPIIRDLIEADDTAITKGSTLDNAANLAPKFLAKMRAKYEGTRLGRQELNAEILDDVPGALWTRATFDEHRAKAAPQLARIVIAVDPSGSSGDDDQADDIGIVAAGVGMDGRGYVLGDWTCDLSPAGWGRRAVEAFDHFEADRIVAERNFGGAMVESVILTARKTAPVKLVTASRGKVARAEPIAALYEQGRVSHVGAFAALEDQLCSFTGDGYIGKGSPDRADALVWALTELMLGNEYRPNYDNL